MPHTMNYTMITCFVFLGFYVVLHVDHCCQFRLMSIIDTHML